MSSSSSSSSQVLSERPGDIVAHIKFTVLLLPTGTAKVTGLPYNPSTIKSDKVRRRRNEEGQGASLLLLLLSSHPIPYSCRFRDWSNIVIFLKLIFAVWFCFMVVVVVGGG